jgi:hypothetical protein
MGQFYEVALVSSGGTYPPFHQPDGVCGMAKKEWDGGSSVTLNFCDEGLTVPED